MLTAPLRLSGIVPVLLALCAAGAAGQAVVVGDVVVRGTAEPLPGVFVAVSDTAGRQVSGGRIPEEYWGSASGRGSS